MEKLNCMKVDCYGHTVYVPIFLIPLFKESTGRDLDVYEIKYDMGMCVLPEDIESIKISDEELNYRVLYSITKEMEDFREGIL